ncbi:putative RNA-directed DNA polymerase [Aphis craccivora]|uniref:Putative RNA-directed DNA polymerase n=1 Tax=Aphis craccivora TaxID=307492 RepID=A0A6G0YZA2_APHCR|nr:putative RNA-directed DNA polymerase [Aphis craccivora]
MHHFTSVLIYTLYKYLLISILQNVAKTFYKHLNCNFYNHCNPLISDISVHNIPDNPKRQLKRKWFHDLLT